jgi:hypothetical protein
MDPEVKINAINKEVREMIIRRAFSLVHVDALHLHDNIIGTRNITRLKHFGTIEEEAKARFTIQGCQDAEKNRIVSKYSDCITCIHSHPHQLRCNQSLSCVD